MADVEKVINGLECCATNRLRREDCEAMNCAYLDLEGNGCIHQLIHDAIALLKAHETATVEPKCIDIADETKAWLDKMDAVDALGNIANICIDWDGYRTADGLGGLINEIWAYARYCADRLLKAQEPRLMTLDEVKHFVYGNPYIIETVLSDGEYLLMYGLFSHQGVVGNCDFITVNERIRLYDADYGKTWRCWTSRPTDEQRKVTLWN